MVHDAAADPGEVAGASLRLRDHDAKRARSARYQSTEGRLRSEAEANVLERDPDPGAAPLDIDDAACERAGRRHLREEAPTDERAVPVMDTEKTVAVAMPAAASAPGPAKTSMIRFMVVHPFRRGLLTLHRGAS